MKFLIPTEPDDSHAALVKISLEEIGHYVRLLFTADIPTKQRNSIFVDNDCYLWRSSDKCVSLLDNDYDVVWWRRARKPFLPQDEIHQDDYKFVMRENALFYESLTYNMAANAWWINNKDAALRANAKLLQLKTAAFCGLNIPITLCSNDPKDIRYFVLRHENEGVIYKPLCSNFWFEKKRVKAAYTAKVSFMDLPANKLLQLSPGIYQKEVKKKYELRITCFGDYLVAVKINSQLYSEGKIDWRAIPQDKINLEPYVLPQNIADNIKKFMRKMGLVFGCMDFIVTPDDQYVFLEVNEQGQFLWIEDYNPEINMLDIFINFIVGKTIHFKWNKQNLKHTIAKYRHAIDALVAQNIQDHVNLNTAEHLR